MRLIPFRPVDVLHVDVTGETPSGVVVPFRPRDQVLRRIGSFRSEPSGFPSITSAPMRIDGKVIISQPFRTFFRRTDYRDLLSRRDVKRWLELPIAAAEVECALERGSFGSDVTSTHD